MKIYISLWALLFIVTSSLAVGVEKEMRGVVDNYSEQGFEAFMGDGASVVHDLVELRITHPTELDGEMVKVLVEADDCEKWRPFLGEEIKFSLGEEHYAKLLGIKIDKELIPAGETGVIAGSNYINSYFFKGVAKMEGEAD